MTGISINDFAKLRDSDDLPLFNRSLQGQYPPGSIIKPIIGLAGLHYGVISASSTVPDPGWYKLLMRIGYIEIGKKVGMVIVLICMRQLPVVVMFL